MKILFRLATSVLFCSLITISESYAETADTKPSSALAGCRTCVAQGSCCCDASGSGATCKTEGGVATCSDKEGTVSCSIVAGGNCNCKPGKAAQSVSPVKPY